VKRKGVVARRGLKEARNKHASRWTRTGFEVNPAVVRGRRSNLPREVCCIKVNEAKSAVARPVEWKFLGFSFSHNKEPKRRIAPKALLRCKQKIRELTVSANKKATKRLATIGDVRPARSARPCGAFLRCNTFGTARPTLRCLPVFLSSAK
jgi:hypothetical protein